MDAQVAIVGAGPAGALLSYLLASRGIETLLIERQSDFAREFRGELLMPSGIRALECAGFDLASVSTRRPDEIKAFMNGQPFLTLRPADLAGDSEGPLPTAVSQPELLEALVERSQATARFEFRRGTTVRRIEDGNDGSRVLHLRRQDSDATECLRVAYLIGADGRGSICRRSLAPGVKIRGTPMDVVWFKMPYPDAWIEPSARIAIGRGHLLIALPSPDGLLQIAWVIVKGTYGDLKSRSVGEWADEMRSYADPELAAHLEQHREGLSRPFLLRAVTDRVVGWATPGALLIGDAAHTMSPVGGQGINIALRDSIVTANELIPALRKGGDLNAAAARVEQLRGPEIDRIQRLAALGPRIVLGRTPFHEAIRRLIPFITARALRRSTSRESTKPVGTASLFLNGVTQVSIDV